MAQAKRLPRRALRAAASRWDLWRLHRSSNPVARQVAAAIRDASRDDFSAESRRWFQRIEALRERVAASAERIEVVDFGAGLPTYVRTDEQMVRGSVSRPQLGPVARTASLSPELGRLLHAVVARTGARRVIELGTCVGISAAYQASALDDHGGAQLITCEGAPALARVAERNLGELGLRRCRIVTGRFAETVPTVAAELAPLDYGFIDGHHDEHATVRYFEMLRPHLAPSAVLVFDDIRWSVGMSRAWDAIRGAPGVIATADLGRVGLIVAGPLGTTAE